MRYDLRVLWVDDTKDFYEETREVVNTYAEDHGIIVNFEYINDPKDFIQKIELNSEGFKIYDMFFIDYALSEELLGSDLIKELKKNELFTDILFYSSQNEKAIRDIISNNVGSYEGVYIAKKINFEEKAKQLIAKNARSLTSLYNIRGFLMDQTSENDFTIRSYVEEKYSILNPDQKAIIGKIIIDSLREQYGEDYKIANELIEKIESTGISNIKKFFSYQTALIPQKVKYAIFMKMLEFLGEDAFDEYSVQEYLDEVVKARNTLAHKKLDVCKMQKYIMYYDTISQYRSRSCPDSCEFCAEDKKYSLPEWENIRKNTRLFEKEILKIQKAIMEISN